MKFPWNSPGIFGNLPQNLPEIFTFRNSYEFYYQNFYILRKDVMNNYHVYKIYPIISTDQNCRNIYTYERRKIWVSGADKNCINIFLCISRKWLAHCYQIPNSWNTCITLNVSPTECAVALQLGFELGLLVWWAGSLPTKPSGLAEIYIRYTAVFFWKFNS